MLNRIRETELDILRIITLLLVILIHSIGLFDTSTNSTRYVSYFIQSIITWEIPVFVMISGRFFLDSDRNVTNKKIIKSIIRLVIAFVVWNIIYQLYYLMTGLYRDLSIGGILSEALIGPYHFWYLYMLIFLYAIVPFLKKIVDSKRLMEYFILLFLLFEFLTNYSSYISILNYPLEKIVGSINFNFALGFSGYFILGYYLKKYPMTGKKEILIYFFGIVSLLITGILNANMSFNVGENQEWFIKYLYPNIALESIAIYTFFVNRVSKINFSTNTKKIFTKLYEYSFGVYLIHALVISIIFEFLNKTDSLLILVLYILLIFIISNLIILGIRKIPKIGKVIT